MNTARRDFMAATEDPTALGNPPPPSVRPERTDKP
jgi:hypothetical protein